MTMVDNEKEEGFEIKSKELGFSSFKCLMLNPSNYTVLAKPVKIIGFMNKVVEAIMSGTKTEEKNYTVFALLFQSTPEVIIQVGELGTAKSVRDAVTTIHAGTKQVRESTSQILMAKIERISEEEEGQRVEARGNKRSGSYKSGSYKQRHDT